MNSRYYRILFIGSIFLSGCDDSNEIAYHDHTVCTDVYVSGITIEIIDKDTRDFIACDAIAIIEENSYSEEVTSSNYDECDNAQYFKGAGERSGIYNIHISKEGYLDWSLHNIEVTSGSCHVNTVHVVAELEK